jgi:D-3-phosphoglycerate dehydrogenase
MDTHKVLIADNLSEAGVEAFNRFEQLEATKKTGLSEDELVEIIPEYSALVVRSATQVTERIMEAATELKAVGRAGVGVDNIDVDAATRQGILVMNTPDGNTISTAEHAFSLLVSTARHIPQAHASMSDHKWERKAFTGVELYGKTLAILGMGRIGTEIARRAIAFGMRVAAYDPYLSASRARGLQVELFESLDELVAQADFITMHMPLTPETQHMVNAERLKLVKEGVRIVNCARGGLIDEAALADALKNGKVAAAALDVYETEPPDENFPLWNAPNLVMTPHLGASTAEAQENVGIEIAENLAAYLIDGVIKNAVNMPSIDSKTLAVIGPYLDLGGKLGRFVSQIAPPRCETLSINYSGKVSSVDTKSVTRNIVYGYLQMMGDQRVNPINALSYADSLGIRVKETRNEAGGEYTDLIEVTAGKDDQTMRVAGTFFGVSPRIVMVNERHVEGRPEGNLILFENEDRPGIVGSVGSTMGKHGVNIARMSLSRNQIGGKALTILNIDSEPPRELIEELKGLAGIFSVYTVGL